MKKLAFVFFIFGIFILIGFYFFQSKEISGIEDLNELENNYLVFVKGKVVEEKFLYGETKLLVLDSDINLICECSKIFFGKEVFVEGIVQEYEGKKQVLVLNIAT